ncbi:ABC transporter ATP-binding protein [Endozoicomonadaceae bacterium StTr2]
MTTASEPLLQIRDLNIEFFNGDTCETAVEHAFLDLYPGETLALVGESGSGKSVTAQSILQLLPRAHSRCSGAIQFAGENLLDIDTGTLRRIRGDRISMIFQEPMTSLNPLHSVQKQIGEVLALHRGLSGAAAEQRIIELLQLVGIQDASKRLNAFPHELSGGQRQRVMIAMALANEPEILIADEPTTALDVTVQRQILALLHELQQKLGMSILLISHDLNLVRHNAHRVAVMQQGKIVETDTTENIFSSPKHPYTRMLINAEPSGFPVAPSDSSEILLQGENLRIWFPIKRGVLQRTVDHVKAVNDISFSLRQGETLGIVGESGSGKSTLGLALLRLQSSKGAIYFHDQPLHQLSQKALRPFRREMQIVFQDPFGSLSPRMTIADIIGEGLEVHGMQDEQQREQLIIKALEEVGLEPETRHRYPHEFSGGQRQRVAIARVMVLKPKLVILDEPTSALDRTVQSQIIDLLRNLQARHNLSYIFISHDLAVVRAMSHRIMVMRNGTVVEEGTREQIFENPNHEYTQALLEAAF